MIDPMVLPICAFGLPVVLVPVIMGIRHARIERELEHAERMKALELGRTLPQDQGWLNLPRISVAIALGVPAAVFHCAWQASQSLSEPEPAWIAAGIVGVTAVVCGSGLTALHFFRGHQAAGAGGQAKSHFDADAYDVVSARG
jgi:hypothetical protein